MASCKPSRTKAYNDEPCWRIPYQRYVSELNYCEIVKNVRKTKIIKSIVSYLNHVHISCLKISFINLCTINSCLFEEGSIYFCLCHLAWADQRSHMQEARSRLA